MYLSALSKRKSNNLLNKPLLGAFSVLLCSCAESGGNRGKEGGGFINHIATLS